MLPVFATIVDQVEPLFVDLSILYPVMAEPPLFEDAVQLRLICEDKDAVAVNPVGARGTVNVVADAVFDGELVNNETVIADTLYV